MGALWAAPVAAQSVHLTDLALATPAVSAEPLSSAAWSGWGSAWVAPAAARRTTGVLLGFQDNGFAGVTTFFFAGRFTLGPLWQISVSQARVSDLFDPALLESYPGLAALDVSATRAGLDVVISGKILAVSLGGCLERDELLGDANLMWVSRASASARVPLLGTATVVLERGLHSEAAGAATGRLTAALGHRTKISFLDVDFGLGVRLGDVWAGGRPHRAAAAGLRARFGDVASLYGAIGTERDPFGETDWLQFASFGIGLTLGPLSAHVRRGAQSDAQAAPTAVSLEFGRTR